MMFDRCTGTRAGRMWIWAAGVVLAASLAGQAALADHHEKLAEWNQDAVTKAAGELQESVRALRNAFEKLPEPMVGGQRAAFFELKDDLRVFDRTAMGLSETLSGGAGREETLPRFKRLETTRRDIVEEARRQDIPNEVLNLAEPVRSSLQQLRPFYLAEPMPEG